MMAFRIFLICLTSLLAASGSSADTKSDTANGLPADISTLVANLDAPDWKTRDRASFELMEISPQWLEPLRRRSKEHLSTEAGLRLRRAAKELYLSREIGPAPACLGIEYAQLDIDWRVDSRLAPGFHAIRITSVFPNTAAARAGLKPGDLVIGMNGSVWQSLAERNGFTPWIFNQRPGTSCTLTVLRNIRGRLVEPDNTRGLDRRGFRGLDTRVVSSDEERRLPAGAVGLRVTSVRHADPRLNLAPGDLIVALDGQLLPRVGAQAALETWASKQPADINLAIPPQPNVRPRANLIVARPPSVQVLRGGRRIELDVTLGHWPLYIAASRTGTRRGASPERLVEIASEFERWWDAPIQSEEKGNTPRRDPALYWQMGP